MSTKLLFNVEVTDTFGDEANYCWVRRFTVKASSDQGAMRIVQRRMGLGSVTQTWDCGDHSRFDVKGAAICAFVTVAEEQQPDTL